MKNVDKAIGFLDFMVQAVFVSTFIFTIVMGIFVWIKDWESVATVLVERWFTIMVGELIVMGFIQIVKELAQAKIRQREEDQ
ncbi:MAG: hypothetical protein ACOX4Q_06620 [Syntrophomonadales bacterium]|jgi:hypothetical protein